MGQSCLRCKPARRVYVDDDADGTKDDNPSDDCGGPQRSRRDVVQPHPTEDRIVRREKVRDEHGDGRSTTAVEARFSLADELIDACRRGKACRSS